MEKDSHEQQGGDIIREFFKQWPQLYYFIAHIFGPVWFTGLSPLEFFEKYNRTGTKANIGSGPRRLRADVINMDVTKYDGVDVVGDIHALPFDSGSLSMIVCDNVLEHVTDAERAAAEIERVLAPGGVGYISTPYLYPFHSSPHDYYRWTHEGLQHLLRNFTIREIGVRGGAMSGLSIWLCYTAARVCSFGSVRAYWFFVNVFLFVFFPIKFLDIILNLFPFGIYTASVFYCVIEKKHEA